MKSISILLVVFVSIVYTLLPTSSIQAQNCPPGFFSKIYTKTISTSPLCVLTVKYCLKVTGINVEVIVSSIAIDAETGSPCLTQTSLAILENNLTAFLADAAIAAGQSIPPCPSNIQVLRVSFGGCRTNDIVWNYIGDEGGGLRQHVESFRCETTYRCWKRYSICYTGSIGNNTNHLTFLGTETEGSPCSGGTFIYNPTSYLLPPDGVTDAVANCNPENCP